MFFPPSRETFANALDAIAKSLCCYMGAPCDCKHGFADAATAARSAEQTGCPEASAAAELLRRMSDAEYRHLTFEPPRHDLVYGNYAGVYRRASAQPDAVRVAVRALVAQGPLPSAIRATIRLVAEPESRGFACGHGVAVSSNCDECDGAPDSVEPKREPIAWVVKSADGRFLYDRGDRPGDEVWSDALALALRFADRGPANIAAGECGNGAVVRPLVRKGGAS